jgi:probable addiction module antidote protein
MSDKITISTLPEFDAANYLKTPDDIKIFLQDALEDGTSEEFIQALNTAARAMGMAEVAHSSGLTREALYKALRPNAKPRFDTISRICAALGCKLVVA